jgi:5-methylcytosine-specific restriction endonuclease McrA
MRQPKELHQFYKFIPWQVVRESKMCEANGKCVRCGSLGEEVHHKIRLTVQNVSDATTSFIQDNLGFLCNYFTVKDFLMILIIKI